MVIAAPSRGATGPPGGLDCQINHETWAAHYEEDRPRVASCGEVALLRIDRAAQ